MSTSSTDVEHRMNIDLRRGLMHLKIHYKLLMHKQTHTGDFHSFDQAAKQQRSPKLPTPAPCGILVCSGYVTEA